MKLIIGTAQDGKQFTLPDEAVTQTFAILAKRGAGKSYTSSVIVEELLKHTFQVIVIDPLDSWFGLRSSADGKSAGMPITIIGGEHGDLPLVYNSGELLADFVVEHCASVVLALRHLRKNEQRQFVTDFCERLYFRKGEGKHRTPLHLVIDEADEFVPQRLFHGTERMFGAVDTLVRRGRSSGIGITLISQRSAAINKDALTQVEVMVALRTISPQDRKAIEAWIEAHDAHNQKAEFMASLASLPIGTAWVWSPGWLDTFERVRIRKRYTFDSSATPKIGSKPVVPKTIAKVDIEVLREKLSEIVEQKKSDDPRELRKTIANLKAQLVHKQPEVKTEVKTEHIVLEKDKKFISQQLVQISAVCEALKLAAIGLDKKIESARSEIAHARQTVSVASDRGKPEHFRVVVPPRRTPRTDNTLPDKNLPRCERAILSVLSQYPNGRNKSQIAIMSGYSVGSGGFSNALSKLRQFGYIEGHGVLQMTPAGRAYVNENDLSHQLPSDGHELFLHWFNKLPRCEREILRYLVNAHGTEVTKEQLSQATGYSDGSGGFNNALSRLRTLELITGRGAVKASDMFIGAGA